MVSVYFIMIMVMFIKVILNEVRRVAVARMNTSMAVNMKVNMKTVLDVVLVHSIMKVETYMRDTG